MKYCFFFIYLAKDCLLLYSFLDTIQTIGNLDMFVFVGKLPSGTGAECGIIERIVCFSKLYFIAMHGIILGQVTY